MEINETIGLVAVIGTIISLVTALMTAATSARASSFKELKEIVSLLKARQKDLEETIQKQETRINELIIEVDVERNLRIGYERYTKALYTILKKANIEAPNIKEFVHREGVSEI